MPLSELFGRCLVVCKVMLRAYPPSIVGNPPCSEPRVGRFEAVRAGGERTHGEGTMAPLQESFPTFWSDDAKLIAFGIPKDLPLVTAIDVGRRGSAQRDCAGDGV